MMSLNVRMYMYVVHTFPSFSLFFQSQLSTPSQFPHSSQSTSQGVYIHVHVHVYSYVYVYMYILNKKLSVWLKWCVFFSKFQGCHSNVWNLIVRYLQLQDSAY